MNPRKPMRRTGRPKLGDTVIVPGGTRGEIVIPPKTANDRCMVQIGPGHAVSFPENQCTVVHRKATGGRWGRAKPIHDMKTGASYDSTSEKKRHDELLLLQQAGEITNLRLHPPRIHLTAGIWWTVDYDYDEAGRHVWEDWKPRPMERDEVKLCKLWRTYGPGLLRITGRKTGTKTIMGLARPAYDQNGDLIIR